MRITFLGTGCGTRYPSVWCDCENCHYARTHGGRNIRAHSSALIDDDLLLDMNDETFSTAFACGASLLNVRDLLVTHAHGDHFSAEWLVWRRMRPGIDGLSNTEKRQTFASRYTTLPLLTIYGNRHVQEKLYATPEVHPDRPEQQLAFVLIEPYIRYELANGFMIPIRAQHGPSEDFAVNYILQRNGKTLLYALDTGGYDEQALEAIAAHRYDMVVMEGTFGLAEDRKGHMTLSKNREMMRFFTEHNLWKGDPKFYLSHLSPHWTPPHDQYTALVKADGMEVAYDGQGVIL